jgi:hypothetical protein
MTSRPFPSRLVLLSAAGLLVAIAGLVYLRDPAWLLRTESGFGPWEVDQNATRFRWMGGHASFFVPSDAPGVTIPLRTTFNEGDRPIVVSISIDDRFVDRVELSDGDWRHSRVRMPRRGTRRVCRIDIRADRTRTGNRAVQVGEIRVR